MKWKIKHVLNHQSVVILISLIPSLSHYHPYKNKKLLGANDFRITTCQLFPRLHGSQSARRHGHRLLASGDSTQWDLQLKFENGDNHGIMVIKPISWDTKPITSYNILSPWFLSYVSIVLGECVLKEINFYCLTIPIPISACHDINIWDILWVYGSIWFIRCRNHCITPMFPQVKMDHSAMIKHMHSVARISN